MKRYIIFIIILVLLLTACSTQKPIENKSTENRTTETKLTQSAIQMGVAGLVPKNYPNPTPDDWKELFSSIKDYGNVFGDYVEFNDNLKNNIPQQILTINELAKQQGFTPVYAIGFKNIKSFKENKKQFKTVATAIAEQLKPKYLAIGVEVNVLYEKNSEDFKEYVNTYKELYGEIKQISPNTKVFPVFQLEYTKGKGKLSGQTRTEEWSLIDQFDNKMDLIGFTTYPYLDYNDPSQIPDDYYTEIAKHTNKKIAFTELAWPSENTVAFTSSEKQQNDFLNRFITLTKSLNPEFIIWTLPHDTQSKDLFSSIALKKNNGKEKQAYSTWVKISSNKA